MLPKKLNLWSLFIQFRLRSIILNHNYFVHNSIVALINCFFPIWIQWGGERGRGSFFFENTNVCKGWFLLCEHWFMNEERGGIQKRTTLCERNNWMAPYNTLLQNATGIITKCNSYFITKCDRILLQNVSGFLLQNVAVQLQIATVHSCFLYIKEIIKRLLR